MYIHVLLHKTSAQSAWRIRNWCVWKSQGSPPAKPVNWIVHHLAKWTCYPAGSSLPCFRWRSAALKFFKSGPNCSNKQSGKVRLTYSFDSMTLSLNEKVMFFTKYLSALLWSLSKSNTNHAVKKQPTHSNAVILLKRQMTVIIVLNIDFPDPGFCIPDSWPRCSRPWNQLLQLVLICLHATNQGFLNQNYT